jgi:hypothetical protein
VSGYSYESFERGLWTVGHRDESGKWHAESDHDDPQAAADRVHYLNGGNAMPTTRQPAPELATATETRLRMAIAFIEQVRDGAYGDLATVDAEQALHEIGMP